MREVIPIYETRHKRERLQQPQVRTSSELFDVVAGYYKDLDREHLGILYLDSGLRVLGFKVESIGATSKSIVDVRLLLKGALLANASSIALVHNHPSGQLSPSLEDRQLTRQIQHGCEIVGIRVIDHLIVADGFFSFSDEGLMHN